MTRPGTQIIARETAPPRSAPTDTGVWFVAGFTEKGKAGPQLVTSLAEFTTKLGGRVAYSGLYDAVDTFFREGGGKVYVSRVFGPTPVTALVDLSDGTNPTLRVSAKSPGAWGNTLNVQVTAGDAGGEFKLVISDDVLGTLETSPSLADKTAAISWAQSSSYVELSSLAGTGDPQVAAAASLATGTDDNGAATDATWLAALDLFTKDLGPGQVSMPGRTTATAHGQLLDHARARNRVAVLDAVDSGTAATLKAQSATLKADTDARYGGLFAPWVTVPGITPGTTRTVPPSPVVAGIMARNDGRGLTPNEPAAGVNGLSQYAIGTTQVFGDTSREDLNSNGVNLLRTIYNQVRVYGFRSLVDPLTNAANWLMLSNSRLYMAIAAKADVIAERYVFAQLDGRRRKIAAFGGDLTGMLIPFYEAGALYGETPEEAFFVDVGASVNTPQSIAAGDLRAVLAVRMSPFGELVTIEIVKVAVTEAVA